MNYRAFIRIVYCCASITTLSACGRGLNSVPSPGVEARLLTPNVHGYKVLYSFKGVPDGRGPLGLGIFSGTLYGTSGGGTANYGAVFRSSLSGNAKIVYSFQGGSDGLSPSSGLTEFRGSRYGVTYFGGGSGCRYGSGCGIVYALDSSDNERVVYRFKPNKTDGWFPTTSLVPVSGLLYGATNYGYEKTCGTHGCGRIYSVSSDGKERVIYRFTGRSDGCWPVALVALKGVLYGIAQGCGSPPECGGNGTVFAVTTSGQETTLHEFMAKSDGSVPTSLITANGRLYGTTLYGGSRTCEGGNRPCGVVFSVTPSGREKVLYRFNGYSDGAGPDSVVWLNHELYGTTTFGGVDSGLGYGTIFSLTLAGVKNILHRFKGVPDGLDPGELINVNGTLYGVTGEGGTGTTCGSYACGTIYKITP